LEILSQKLRCFESGAPANFDHNLLSVCLRHFCGETKACDQVAAYQVRRFWVEVLHASLFSLRFRHPALQGTLGFAHPGFEGRGSFAADFLSDRVDECLMKDERVFSASEGIFNCHVTAPFR
jgi:hypothetical protein